MNLDLKTVVPLGKSPESYIVVEIRKDTKSQLVMTRPF